MCLNGKLSSLYIQKLLTGPLKNQILQLLINMQLLHPFQFLIVRRILKQFFLLDHSLLGFVELQQFQVPKAIQHVLVRLVEMLQFHHQNLKLKLHRLLLWQLQQRWYLHLLQKLILRLFVLLCLHFSSRILVEINLQSSKYRDVVVEKLIQHMVLNF